MTEKLRKTELSQETVLKSSVVDPDPHVFRPTGSGSISQTVRGTDMNTDSDLDPSIINQKQ
jgi:hypothetical protein